MKPGEHTRTAKARILELAAREPGPGHPGGFCRATDFDMTLSRLKKNVIHNAVGLLVKSGAVQAVKISHRHVRYFTDAQVAMAFAATLAGTPCVTIRAPSIRLPAGDGMVTDRTRVTVAPPKRDHRFAPDPGACGDFMAEWRQLRGEVTQ